MPWRRNQEPKRLLTYIDLVQDIDVLLPIVLAVRERTDWPQEIRVARWLASASPRSAQLLRAHRLPFRWTLRRGVIAGRTPSLSSVGAVLTAAESTSDTHTAGHALANRARASGIAAFTVQHGLENVALRADEEGRWETLASDHIFVWSDGVIDAQVPTDTLRKRLAVGRARMARQPATPTFDVAVFENLHAPRYDAADHARFLSGIDTLLAMSGLKVLLRAHPAGGWLDAHAADLRRHPHVTLIDSRTARNQTASGADAAASAARVITSPSTIALDAAQADRTVALSSRGCDLYDPLPVLEDGAAWAAFARAAPDLEPSRAFASRTVRLGDAADEIIRHLAPVMAR